MFPSLPCFQPLGTSLTKRRSPRPLWVALVLLLSWGSAYAQITVDGRVTASEIGTGSGKYRLVSSYTGTHLEADRGLKALYVGYTATTMNLMLVGSAQSATAGAYRAMVVYLNTPARPGTPAGTRLAGGNDTGGSPLAHRPTMDMQVDYGFRTVVGSAANDVYFSAVSYATGAGTPTPGTDSYVGQGTTSGAVVTNAATSSVLPGARYAYFNTASLSANTAAVNAGMEIEIPLSALGGTALTASSQLDLFAAFTDSNGQFITADLIPEVAGRTTGFGIDPDFTLIAGNQFVATTLGGGSNTTGITVNGRLDTSELGTGTQGLYQLVGQYLSPHPSGFGDYGLTKLYMANTATKVYLFAVGTVENNGNTFQLYFNVPGLTGVPRGAALPGTPPSGASSFENMHATLDLETDLGLALQGGVFSGTSTPAFAINVARYAGTIADQRLSPAGSADGTPLTFNSPTVTQFNGMVTAYRTSPTGLLSGNPGNFGWEIELDRAALGVPSSLANAAIQAFLVQNNNDGSYLSTDMIPEVPGLGATNPGPSAGVDFTQLPGRQALTYALSCPTTVTVALGASSYCQTGANPTAAVTGPAGGSFSAPTGLSVNAATGVLNLAASTPGTYALTYNADIVNCPTSATTQVTVTRPATAGFTFPAAAYCATFSAAVTPTLAANATAGTYTAASGLALNATTGAVTPSASAPGTYTVTNTVAAAGGCAAVTATAQVVINAAPAAAISAGGPTTFCQGGSVTLTASGGSSYAWSTGATSPSITVSAGGTYSVRVTSAAGCSATANTAVSVTPVASAAFNYATGSYCTTGTNATPTVTGTTGGTFRSAAGLSLNPSTGAIALASSTPGTYTVTYTAGSSCPASASVQVTLAAPATAGFGYGSGSFCATQASSVPAVLAAAATAGTFSAATGLGLNSTTGAITPGTSTPGTYTVTNTVAATGGCAAVTGTASVTIAAPATAAFSYPASVLCAGTSSSTAPVLASGATAGTFTSSTGLTLNAQTGAVDPATSAAGTYTVTNTVAAAGPCAAVTASSTITIAPLPVASVAASGPTTFCTGGSVVLTAAGGASYQHLRNGAVISGATSAAYTATAGGAYSVVVTSASGCSATTAAIAVTVNPATTATFTYSGATFCASGSTAPTATVTGTAGGTFSSTSGLGLTPTTGAIALTSSAPGTYTVTYSVGGPCPSSATATVTITAAPIAGFTYGSTSTFCVSGTTSPAVTLGTGASAGTFSSTTGLTLNATTGAITLSTSAPGTYTVTNTIAAASGCAAATATATATITAAPVATFSYPTTGTCAGSTTPVTPALGTGATAGTFASTPGLALNATTGAVDLATSTAGTYSVTNTVAAASGCAAAAATATLTVTPRPATPTLSAAYNGSTTTLTSSAATGNQFYLNGMAIAGATGQTYVANSAAQLGAYTVVVTNASGCASAPSAPLTVTSSVKPLAGTALHVYPNPTHDGNFHVELTGYRYVAELSVLNALGQAVFTATFPASVGTTTQAVNISQLPTGIYLLRVKTVGGLDTRRVVKE